MKVHPICRSFTGYFRCLLLVCSLTLSQFVLSASEESREDKLTRFERSDDIKILVDLVHNFDRLSPEEQKKPLRIKPVDKVKVIDDARFALRLRRAIAGRTAALAREREPVGNILKNFMQEQKKRTDQPFITFGVTKPEDLPDPVYRKQYSDFLTALQIDKKHAEMRGILNDLQRATDYEVTSLLRLLPKAEREAFIQEEALKK